MAAKDGKRPLVVHLKAGPRPASPSIMAFVFALMVSTGVDSLDDLGGNVSRPGRLVFHSRHARRDILRHLVRTKLGSGCLLPHLPPLELPSWVFFLEGDVESLLQNLRHMPLSILHTHDFGQSLELLFEAPIGREPEVLWGAVIYGESVGPKRVPKGSVGGFDSP